MDHLEEKIKKHVENKLRQVFRWSKQYRNTQNRCRVAIDIYRCEGCDLLINKNGKSKLIELDGELILPGKLFVDHIEPVCPVEGWSDLGDWARNIIVRVFAPEDGLQYLCKDCHQQKTNAENVERRLYKTTKKEG